MLDNALLVHALGLGLPYSRKVWPGKVWRVERLVGGKFRGEKVSRFDSLQAFGKRKFGKLIYQPIDY